MKKKRKSKNNSEKTEKKDFETAFSPGGYYKTRTDYYAVMSNTAVSVISFFASLQHYEGWLAEDEDRKPSKWVYCSIKFMEKTINLKKHQQDKVIKELREKGFLETQTKKRKGKSKKTIRYFRVKWTTIKIALDKTKTVIQNFDPSILSDKEAEEWINE